MNAKVQPVAYDLKTQLVLSDLQQRQLRELQQEDASPIIDTLSEAPSPTGLRLSYLIEEFAENEMDSTSPFLYLAHTSLESFLW